ncbi:hypothetical protein GCM10020000_75150 [Streptomyces olivoverticillatus]
MEPVEPVEPNEPVVSAVQALPAETTEPTEPAPTAASVASRRRNKPSSRGAWAHRAVHESFAAAKIHSEEWESYGFRIEPEVLEALKKRIKQDRRSSGNSTLALGHYLDAALRHAPVEVEEQVALAQRFLDDRMGFVGKGKQSTYRVGRQAHALMAALHQELQEADYGRRGLYVVSAAIEQLLQTLEIEGKLTPPIRKGWATGALDA